ncbi:hypothetical protein LZ31DRAFT_616287 [Colletotrichum somersetense]|nr:hypothetical protein LZ31DRAFT_616287 [Colletotrichum somersetense]
MPRATRRKKRKAPQAAGSNKCQRVSETIGDQLYDTWDESTIGSEARKFIDKNYPSKTLEQLDSILPKTVQYDEDWCTVDEQNLQASWAADPERPSLVLWPEKKDIPAHFLKLWKLCVRLHNCTPRQLVSRANHLAYDNVNNPNFSFRNSDGEMESAKSSAWTARFCETFAQLMCQPLFQGNAKLLVTALQYASMTRTNERQDWPLTNPTGEPFFDALTDVISEHRGPNEEPASLRRKAVDVLEANGMSPPLLERFMSLLEDVSSDPNATELKGGGGGGGVRRRTYKIQTMDLTNIRKTLESMAHTGMPLWALTPKTYSIYGTKGRSQDGLPTSDQLSDFHERDMIAERRWKAKEKNCRRRIEAQ